MAGALAALAMTGCGDDKSSNKVDAGGEMDAGGETDAPLPEPLRIIAGPESLTVREGSSGTVLVVLNRAPDAPVSLTVTSSASSVASVAPATLTFSAANFAVPQAVVVTGAQDADTANGSASVSIAGADLTTVTIAVAVEDDDAQAILANPAALTLSEGGAAGAATVRLAFAPAADFVVTVTSTDPARLEATPATLTFTAANFDQPQSVSLKAKDDEDSLTNNAQVAFKGTGVADALVAVTLIDDDAQSLVLSPDTIMVNEGDEAGGTFTVKLARETDRDVKVSLAALGAEGVTVTPAELTFTTANYNMAQTVKVVAAGDSNTVDETVQVTAAIAGLAPQTVSVTVNDDDEQAIVLSAATVAVTEGASGSFSVKLAFDPGASTTVTVASADAAAASVQPTTLIFDSSNYDNAQTVNVAGVQDDDLANETVVITASATGVPNATITANVTDNDTQAIVATPTTLSVVEGQSETVTVKLAFRPATTVTVNVASAAVAAATVSPATLTFAPDMFDVEQTVTVLGVTDADLSDASTTVSLSSDAAPTKAVPVTVVDADVQNILATPNTLQLSEGGPAKTFTARLAFAPQDPITVTLTSSNPKVTVSPSTLTFSNTSAQTVTVSPTNDPDAVDEVANIELSADGLTTRTINVTVEDAQTQAHLLSLNALDVKEEGAAGTFTVRLQAQPVSATTVTIGSEKPASVVVSTNGGLFTGTATLTFLPENYSIAQTVSVRGLSDLNLVDEIVTLTVSSPVAPSAAVLVRNQEDDLQQIVGAPGDLIVTEGTPSVVQVALRFQPVTTVAVNVKSLNETIIKVNGGLEANLTFTTTNWDKPQSVSLTTPDDSDQVDRGATSVVVSSPGLTSQTINVTAKDDDEQVILVSSAGVPVTETSTAKFTVRLAYTPLAATETVTLTSADLGAVTVSPSTIVFNAANYSIPVEVTLAGIDDVDLLNESVAITLDSDAPLTADVTVTASVSDNDPQAILLSKTSIPLIEGDEQDGTATFLVHLQFDPTQPLTVNLLSADGAAVTVSPATLTFTSAGATKYDVDQMVTVTAVGDADVRNESVIVTLSAEGVQSGSVTVTVQDDDTQGIVAGLEALVLEGATKPIPVQLAAEPTDPVVIAATSSIPSRFSVAPATLTFDKDNWNIAQDFVLTGVQDDDLDDHAGSLSLAITSAQGNTPREGAPNHQVDVTVGDDDSQTIIVQQLPASPFVLSVQEQGPSASFKVKLGHKPRDGQNDTVDLTQASNKLVFLTGTALTFTSGNWQDFQTVTVAGAGDEDSEDESVTVTLAIAEPDDRQPGVTVVPPTATQIVRVIDDEVAVIDGKLYSDLNGATEFTRRSNISFGTTLFAITARNALGETVLARDSRELNSFFQGPVFASGGISPTTEVVDFDGSGFSTFSSDSSGVVFSRFAEDLSSTLTPGTTVAPGDVDDFWPVRTSTGYAVVYRRVTSGLNKGLFFRTLQLDGTFGDEKPITSPSPNPQERANVHFIAGSQFNGVDAPYLVVYSTNTELRCARLGPNGEVRVDEVFANPVYVSSVQNPSDPAEIALAYYDASVGLVGRKIRAGTSTQTGACQTINTKTLRGIGSGTYRSMPTIAFNGQSYAVAFDVFVNAEDRVGVALWDGADQTINMLVGGSATGTADQGSRPSVAWAEDRWVVRYRADSASGVKVRTGSFKATSGDFPQQDE